MSSDYSIGVEEEFFLTETSSGLIVPQMPAGFVRACNRHVAGEATYELMQSQIETTTPVCRDPGELRQMLVALRTGLADVAADFGLSLVAAGTHPLGEWREGANRSPPSPRAMNA